MLPPPVLGSSATAEGGRLDLRHFPSQIPLAWERENAFYFLYPQACNGSRRLRHTQNISREGRNDFQ